jgi:hypothetical protein
MQNVNAAMIVRIISALSRPGTVLLLFPLPFPG